MVNNFFKKMKEQKGLTLVELLAVIVILGIIAGIAVPSVGKIIDNSRVDAHGANIEMIEAAGKLAKASGEKPDTTAGNYSIGFLKTKGYLEEIPKSPWDDTTNYSGSVTPEGQYVKGTGDVTPPGESAAPADPDTNEGNNPEE